MFFKLKSISKKYGGKTILDKISFEVDKGDIVTIIGPSGVGKTTLLKIIAGLERATAGELVYEVNPTVAHPVILVFQDFILFPNLSVFENVAFGLRARKFEKGEIETRVSSILSYFNLVHKRNSYPLNLSAGQRQRVAIARAMVVNPSILLLDEPFAHLDYNLRLDTAEFIRTTQKAFGVTTVSVTHDLQEAFAMSDRIGIMLDGRLVQYDTVEKIYFQPRTFEVAKFLGPVNIIPEKLFHTLGIPSGTQEKHGPIFARAEGISIEKDENGPGIVVDVCFVGVLILYKVEIEGNSFMVYSLSDGIAEGDKVRLKIIKYSFSEKGS
jgi:putative spermidine/putrescine transport system ATP-binding protein